MVYACDYPIIVIGMLSVSEQCIGTCGALGSAWFTRLAHSALLVGGTDTSFRHWSPTSPFPVPHSSEPRPGSLEVPCMGLRLCGPQVVAVVMADRRDWGGGGDDPEESTQWMIERIWESLTNIRMRMDQQAPVPPVIGEAVPMAPVPPQPGVECVVSLARLRPVRGRRTQVKHVSGLTDLDETFHHSNPALGHTLTHNWSHGSTRGNTDTVVTPKAVTTPSRRERAP
ncbi:hypothetical protein Taro_024771 [Colocasia esculenta]|uniref:Uncharacterized protein n=1 Tax=Colocasia esculenta TaxID=4460 RepID=A0A843V8D0_COLES|nr:hypothetical protein [Colocasia esculenta]